MNIENKVMVQMEHLPPPPPASMATPMKSSGMESTLLILTGTRGVSKEAANTQPSVLVSDNEKRHKGTKGVFLKEAKE